jgi:tetratricopeptide (TPR) repeat protein
VDQARFDEALKAYEGGEYRQAAKGFLSAAGRGTAGNGSAYHYAGNSLMRLRRWRDAVTVYGHALRDESYTKRGAVFSNLGQAYTHLAEYSAAIDAYRQALEESDFTAKYKAHQGMAAAYLEMGKHEEAASEYRTAALDPENPDPGKALVNLGLCFMALNRPADAVESYKAALGFENYQGRGKALSNLGQAYVALGEYSEALSAFDKATGFHGYELGPAAAEAFETAKRKSSGEHPTVEGWETGEVPPVVEPVPATVTDEFDEAPGLPPEAAAAASQLGMGDDAAVSKFFTMTEEEMKQADREARRAERDSHESSRKVLSKVLIVVAIIVVFVAALGILYSLGYGWPTQSATVKGLLQANAAGKDVTSYWIAVPDKDVAKEMAKLPPVSSFKVESVNKGSTVSAAYVQITPKQGAPLRYKITLQREGVGWKVVGVENNWGSSGN